MRVIAIAMIICAAAVCAADEPKELLAARKQYEKSIKALTDPVRREYLQQLDTMKKDLGDRGDIDGARAVQDEIAKVQAESKGKMVVMADKFTVPAARNPNYDWEHACETGDAKTGTVVFKAKATTEIIVRLATEKDNNSCQYGVVLGWEWGKTSHVFAGDCHNGLADINKGIKDPVKPGTYWIRWAPTDISCGYGSIGGREVILKAPVKTKPVVNYVVFTSGSSPLEIEYVSLK